MDDATSQTIPNVDAERREKGCVGLVLKSRGDNSDHITGLDYDMMVEPQLLDALYSVGTTGATQKVQKTSHHFFPSIKTILIIIIHVGTWTYLGLQ